MSDARFRQIADIFRRARGCDAAEREAILDEACDGDETLRADVESLLVIDGRGPEAVQETEPVRPARASTADKDRIGPYRLIENIGMGGMGAVYLAEQTEPIRRTVALKLIKRGMDSKSVIARFEAERQALALMNHPHVAKVLDAGLAPDGRPFFVMEHVPGEELLDYCDKHRLTIEQRLEIFMKVCSAIEHAHQKGVIHRDIKPSNVLVTLDGETPIPKVIDFGVAKAMHQKLTEKTLYTEQGQFIGTPEYMSPEQAEMTGLDVDTRTDVYALGVLLYQLLTGVLPFDSAELRAAGFDEIRRKIREDDPPRPSTRLSSIDAETSSGVARSRGTTPPAMTKLIRGDLDWITMKALEKDRTRRYQTVGDLRQDVERSLRNEPVSAHAPSAGYRVGKFVRRNRGAVIGAAAVLTVLLLGLAGTLWGLAAAIDARDAERGEREAAEAVSGFLKEMLASISPSVRGLQIDSGEFIDEATARLDDGALAGQPAVEAEVRTVLGHMEWRLGRVERAAAQFEAALAFFRSVYGETDLHVADAHSNHGNAIRRLGDVDGAERELLAAIELYRGIDISYEHYSGTLFRLADLYWEYDRFVEAHALFTEALDNARANLPPDHNNVMLSLRGLAYTAVDLGNYDEARALFAEALPIVRRMLGPDHPDTAQTLLNQSRFFAAEGDLAAAEQNIREANAILNARYGEVHPHTNTSLYYLAKCLWDQDRYAEAEAAYRRLVELNEQVLPDGHFYMASNRLQLGWVIADAGRYEEAEPLMLRAQIEMEASINAPPASRREAIEGLIVLYDAWDKPEPAARWRARLAALEN